MITPLFLTLAAVVNTGQINGKVLDQGGAPVTEAVVVVLDGKSGVPVRRRTWAPFPDGDVDMESAMEDIAFARTDDDGSFEFSEIPASDYRLLAQSWIDAPPPSNVLGVNGPIMHVRGTAAISVVAGETTSVHIRPSGDATLVLGDHAANDETLLVLSTSPPHGDVALGFMAWPGPFLKSMVGFNRMPDGVTTVRGLPEGEIHVAVFSADNSGGHGATSLTLDNEMPMYVKIPILAPWSNGIHQPPPALEELTARVAEWSQAERVAIAEQWMELAADPENPDAGITSRSVAQAMSKAADRMVEIAADESVPLLNVMAALRYVSLMERLQRQDRAPNPWRPAESRPARPKELLRDAASTLHGEIQQLAHEYGSYLRYVPAGRPNASIVIVHGSIGPDESALRAAKSFCDRWVDLADQHRIVLLAPAFDQENFGGHAGPGGGYRGLFGRDVGADVFVNAIVDDTPDALPSLPEKFGLYGHSAGGQFVSRYLVLHPERVAAAVISAAGTFAFPDPDVAWTNGMKPLRRRIRWSDHERWREIEIIPDPDGWVKASQIPITVVVGEQDTDETKAIPGNPGRTHVERAKAWVRAMRRHARDEGPSALPSKPRALTPRHEAAKGAD